MTEPGPTEWSTGATDVEPAGMGPWSEAESGPVPTDPRFDPELLADEQAQRLQLRRALAELPPEQQEVVILRLEQELSLEEIGQITGVGRETVKSRLRYAMDKLRARLSE